MNTIPPLVRATYFPTQPEDPLPLSFTYNVVHIEADRIEEIPNKVDPLDSKSGELCAKDANGKVIANFDLSSISGWWLDQEV